jgi:hypothetical protein
MTWHHRRVRIEAAVVYQADADVVFAMMTDQEYVSRKATAMGALEHDVTVSVLPTGGAVIRLQRTMPAMVPDFVRPLVGQTIDVVQTDEWGAAVADGSRSGRLTAQISKAPVTLSGEVLLEPNGERGCVHRVSVEAKAKVPFVGAKIEKAIGELILMAARKEEQVGGQWLAERG